ncbi:MAG: DUF3332 domain-containing protein [Bacteroidaceae bacterium]|nr:DUF3332 domain-containing protein [Bacteroidaceae bacterium]
MKKFAKLSVMMVAFSIMFSSCIGSFQLTSKLKNFNDGIGSKWVNELVFVAFCIVPVYELSALADVQVLNSIEFWSGKKALADAGETKIIKNSKGQDIEVKTLENGYALNDGTNTINLVFDEKEQIWSAEYEDQVMNLIRLVDENNAQLFLKNGEVMDITLNADGIEAARLHMYDCLAMNE